MEETSENTLTGFAVQRFRSNYALPASRSDRTKVLWTLQYLKGKPREACYNKYDKIDCDQITWKAHASFLLNLIINPTNDVLHLNQLYHDARQSPNQSVSEFAAYVDQIESQLPPYTEEQRWMHLFAKLRPDLRIALTYQELPDNLNDLILHATRLDKGLRQDKTEASRYKTRVSKRQRTTKENRSRFRPRRTKR